MKSLGHQSYSDKNFPKRPEEKGYWQTREQSQT